MVHHPQNARNADAGRVFVEPQRLARLVQQDIAAGGAGGGTQTAVAQFGAHHNGGAKGFGPFQRLLRTGRYADLWHVGAVLCRGMQIDPKIGPRDNFAHEQIGQPRGKRPGRRTRKHPVQIAPVGEIT